MGVTDRTMCDIYVKSFQTIYFLKKKSTNPADRRMSTQKINPRKPLGKTGDPIEFLPAPCCLRRVDEVVGFDIGGKILIVELQTH